MFNVLDGITFFVVYTNAYCINIRGRNVKNINNNVVGYTLHMDK